MSKKKKKFAQEWSNQTNLGKKFGLSAIKVGKILIENELKDPQTKHATSKALSEGFAKSTPLKDGTPYFMWNTKKIRKMLFEDHQELNKVDYWTNEVRKSIKEAEKLEDEEEYKLAQFAYEFAYDEVPKEILEEVRSKVEPKTEEEV